MTARKMLNELDQLEAMADTMKDKCSRLRSQLERGVGTRSSTRKGKYAESTARAIAKRTQTINKKRATACRP